MVIGDMPPLLLLDGWRCPRGPFCIPLRTSIRPIVASWCVAVRNRLRLLVVERLSPSA
jgi:hypothetical protein